jgi:Protein of unknown function (DUF1360)
MTATVHGTDATKATGELYRPLGSYATLTALFLGGFGVVLGLAEARSRLPRRFALEDIVLGGVAAHKLSRLVATDEVTAFMRAPFVDVRQGDEGDLEEEPRGTGPRRALGELLSCPSCVGQWSAAGFVAGHLLAPRTTRALASIFVADAISDFLHVAYRGLKERA